MIQGKKLDEIGLIPIDFQPCRTSGLSIAEEQEVNARLEIDLGPLRAGHGDQPLSVYSNPAAVVAIAVEAVGSGSRNQEVAGDLEGNIVLPADQAVEVPSAIEV
jgi:hypothetical protein